jgi:hypothetical protein
LQLVVALGTAALFEIDLTKLNTNAGSAQITSDSVRDAVIAIA